MTVGGIAYQDPDELITHIAEEGTTISPAIVVLEAGVKYTFKFVDDVYPYGITFEAEAYENKDGTVVTWEAFDHESDYVVTYYPQTNTNTFSAAGEAGTPMVSDVYTPGSTHKIVSDAIDNLTIDIIQFDLTAFRCAYSASDLLTTVMRYPTTVRLVSDYYVADSQVKQVLIANRVYGIYGREGNFTGVVVTFDTFDQSNYLWTDTYVRINTAGEITSSTIKKYLTVT